VLAGRDEIGGVLMAEHVGANEFVVRNLTINGGGTFASFVRGIEKALVSLSHFFRETRNNYVRYNYIGEWHSHPLFEPWPSNQDHVSMYEIANDHTVGANFVVLMIVKLDDSRRLKGTVHTYLPHHAAERSTLLVEK